jgi:hypothetical protein
MLLTARKWEKISLLKKGIALKKAIIFTPLLFELSHVF